MIIPPIPDWFTIPVCILAALAGAYFLGYGISTIIDSFDEDDSDI